MSVEVCPARRAAIERLCKSVDAMERSAHTFDPHAAHPLMGVASVLYSLGEAIADCERRMVTRDTILKIIAPARDIYARSPFVRRLQEWPRGYPGGFEAVEQLAQQRNLAAPQSYAWFIEELVLSSPVAQQHRNRLAHQADLMLRAIFDPDGNAHEPIRILLIASGGAPDLRAIVPLVRGRDCRFVLNDFDANALSLAASTLKALGPQCTFVHGNVHTSLSRLAGAGPFDLVLMGGLLDYLEDRAAAFLLKHMFVKLCRQGGLVYFSNIARGNPYRGWIEFLADWKPLERDEKDIQALLEPFAAHIGGIQMWRDPSRLTIFSHVRRRNTHLI